MVIFDSTSRRVKSARRPFALGLSRSRPERPTPYTFSDLTWWSVNSPTNASGYEVVARSAAERLEAENARLEQEAGCALVQARMDAGCPIF